MRSLTRGLPHWATMVSVRRTGPSEFQPCRANITPCGLPLLSVRIQSRQR